MRFSETHQKTCSPVFSRLPPVGGAMGQAPENMACKLVVYWMGERQIDCSFDFRGPINK